MAFVEPWPRPASSLALLLAMALALLGGPCAAERYSAVASPRPRPSTAAGADVASAVADVAMAAGAATAADAAATGRRNFRQREASRAARRRGGGRVGRARRLAVAALAVAAPSAGARGSGPALAEERDIASAVLQQLQAGASKDIDQGDFLAMCADVGGEKVLGFFQELFQKSDLNGDGRLNRAEQEYMNFLAMESFSLEAPAEDGRLVRDDVGSEFLREFDTNGDGVLDLAEFMVILRDGIIDGAYDESVQKRFLNWSKEAYERADVDSDGILKPTEATFIMFILRDAVRFSVFHRMKIVGMLLDQMDTNNDGRISVPELESIIQKAKRAGIAQRHIYSKMLQHFEEVDADTNMLLDEGEIMKLTAIVDEEL